MMTTNNRSNRTVLSVFTGAGGLDLGLEAAGFRIRLCVEVDEDARRTLRKNRPRWPLAEPGDIHASDPVDLVRQARLQPGEVTLLAGGPPCQPFSKSGYWSSGDSRRLQDPRSRTLRAYLRVVEASLPNVLLIENVKGLAFRGKDEGLQLLQKGLRAINRRRGTKYDLDVIHLNTADYGVPQCRERIFLVASTDGRTLKLPPPTHGDADGLESHRTCWDSIGDLDTDDWPLELAPDPDGPALCRFWAWQGWTRAGPACIRTRRVSGPGVYTGLAHASLGVYGTGVREHRKRGRVGPFIMLIPGTPL